MLSVLAGSVKKGRLDEAEMSLCRVFGPDCDARRDVLSISENLTQLKQSKQRKSDYMARIHDHPELYKGTEINIDRACCIA